MEEKFKVTIVGILFNPSTRKILVGKNKGDEKLSFVEGDLKYEEELDVGLKRVTKEKTGYIIHNLGAIFAKNKLKEMDTLQIYFLCEATEGEETPSQDVEELKWIKPTEVENELGEKLPTRLREYILNLE